jgi:hypothetical protein
MNARTPEPGSIPSAPFDDLDLDSPEDEAEWDRRVVALAAERIAAERLRLERLGIIDTDGELVSRDLRTDMLRVLFVVSAEAGERIRIITR